MYLSRLSFNVAERAARRNFSTPYHLHATVMQGFPGHANSPQSRVLFRHEPAPPGRSQWSEVLVQSHAPPDWSGLSGQLENALRWDSKTFALALHNGQRLRFRLRANPVVTRNGKRLPLRGEESLRGWLDSRAAKHGFSLVDFTVQDEGDWQAQKTDGTGEHRVHIATALYQGVLAVRDAAALHRAVAEGIGPAKGFGCGLLSLARA